MKNENNFKEPNRLTEARESFTARLLTNAQFEEVIAITGIMERAIAKSGSFKNKLGDYSYAIARSEKMDAGKAEMLIRDLFRVRTGQTMNQMRETLAKSEGALGKTAEQTAYTYALAVGDMIRDGNKIAFQRAYAHQAEILAGELGVSDNAAKALMRDAFRLSESGELYEWGKRLEEEFYRPQIDAEIREHLTQSAQQEERTGQQQDQPSKPLQQQWRRPPRTPSRSRT